MDEAFARLEAQYCPPIDPALLSAILSDFDLSVPTDLQTAHATLEALKESALIEEAAGFDASGTGGADVEESDAVERSNSGDGAALLSKTTSSTAPSDRLSSLNLRDDVSSPDTPLGETIDLDSLDQETKINLLEDVFGKHATRYQLKQTLQRCNGKWNLAMDELLNHVYFGEEGVLNGNGSSSAAKGIDGFSEENVVPRGRKNRSNGKRAKKSDSQRASSMSTSSDSPAPIHNKWQAAADDVDFIASRTGVKKATISSMYYESGASLPKTIAALIESCRRESRHIPADEESITSTCRDLHIEYPTIPEDDLMVLVRLTHPSTAAARDLANALIEKPRSTPGGIQIIPQYTRLIDSDEPSTWKVVTKASRSAASSPGRSSVDVVDSAATRRDRYDLAREAALSQARAAHRKAKSDHLMSGAVAVYHERGREFSALSARASAQAADDLVAGQSTASQVDLHGVDVLNAVRIADEKVERWWDGLGENRVNGRMGVEDRQAGYRIVVGVGRHSEGGKSKLGPAVSKMLKERGWRFDPPTGGVILVRGPLRR